MSSTASTQRVKDWYYHHGKVTAPAGPPPAPPFLLKPSRKPSPLAPHQAYSILFCRGDSALYAELRSEWERFKAGDEQTVDKYHHLFPEPVSANMKFVTFQQAILKERIPLMTEEESQEVQKLIETRLQEERNLHDNPWQALKVDTTQSDAELKRRYIAE